MFPSMEPHDVGRRRRRDLELAFAWCTAREVQPDDLICSAREASDHDSDNSGRMVVSMVTPGKEQGRNLRQTMGDILTDPWRLLPLVASFCIAFALRNQFNLADVAVVPISVASFGLITWLVEGVRRYWKG